MEKFNESQLENAVIELLQNNGWQYSNGEYIHRRPQDVLLEDDLREYLQLRYAEENLTENEIQTIITNIKYTNEPSLFQANRSVFNLVCTGFYLKRDNSDLPNLQITYIDFEKIQNNTYRCVNQFTVKHIAERRPDVLLFVNGIPLVIIELKNATNEETTIADA